MAACTYRAEPAWPDVDIARGMGPCRAGTRAVQEKRGGGTAQAHSSLLKGPLLLREEAVNGEDKAEVR